MVMRSIAEHKKELNLSLFVTVAPVIISIRVCSKARSGGSAVNDILESPVFKNECHHLALVCIVISVVVDSLRRGTSYLTC
jgi:hypothetical protein